MYLLMEELPGMPTAQAYNLPLVNLLEKNLPQPSHLVWCLESVVHVQNKSPTPLGACKYHPQIKLPQVSPHVLDCTSLSTVASCQDCFLEKRVDFGHIMHNDGSKILST